MSTQYWTAWIGEGDEVCPLYLSESEAIGEVMCQIDANHEPGEEVEYTVAPMLSAHDVLRTQGDERIGRHIAEIVVEWLADDMACDEWPIDLPTDQHEALGRLVVDFFAANAKSQWWTTDTKNKRTGTYVAGSDGAEGQQP